VICPDANTLSAMLDDQAVFAELEVHIDGCEECRKAVAAFALGSKPLAKIDPFASAGGMGASLDDRYVIESVLGSGGMGRIVSARDRHLDRTVALKELREQRPELAARFKREALLTARLEHPNIVSLHEAGTWPTGEPFYTMRLVSGRPLDVVIAQAENLGERLALLPHVIAVADALAYAHRERIIHRDLKPQNVMVGEFGETIVIDWGLAKDLATVEDEVAAGTAAASAGPSTETKDGEVMGTPAYMPPEQATAQLLDPRADVYSIGAILYHVLAGDPPYTGRSSLEVITAVISGPPVVLGERQPGVQSDLLAIVDRAMARDPEARYPTARELADDLRRFQAGQLVGAHRYSPGQILARWVRRHRAAVIVAGVALAVLVTLGGVALQRIVRAQRAAEAQRALADTNRGDAEALLDFMMVDLNAKLKPVGRLDVLDDAAKKATAYYDRRNVALDDVELAKRALARRNLGDVLYAQGHSDQALRELRSSEAITQALATKDPANVDRQHDLAVTDEKIGNVLLALGHAAEALAAHRRSLAIDETLETRDPTNVERKYDVSVGRDKIGDVLLASGDAAGALVEYRAGLAIRETIAGHDRGLYVSHQKIGTVLLAQGDSAAGLASHESALAIAEKRAAEDPSDSERQYDVAMGHYKVGDVLVDQGNLPAALVELRASLAIAGVLAVKDPTNVLHQNHLVVTHQELGDVLFAQREMAAALVEYRASLTIAAALAAADPANIDYTRNLSVSHEKVGDALLAQHDPAGALAAYREALAIVEKLAAKDPNNAVLQSDLFLGHAKLGDTLLATGDLTRALAEHRAALVIAERLAAQDPTNAERQSDLSVGRIKLGDVLLAQHDQAGALGAYQTALAIAERFHAKDPQDAEWNTVVTELPKKIATCCPGAPKH
jgi:tetratricopeptide (TPR) repeat protein/tRNA A-37 threonylcarbamoyl transferase component Bud32